MPVTTATTCTTRGAAPCESMGRCSDLDLGDVQTPPDYSAPLRHLSDSLQCTAQRRGFRLRGGGCYEMLNTLRWSCIPPIMTLLVRQERCSPPECFLRECVEEVHRMCIRQGIANIRFAIRFNSDTPVIQVSYIRIRRAVHVSCEVLQHGQAADMVPRVRLCRKALKLPWPDSRNVSSNDGLNVRHLLTKRTSGIHRCVVRPACSASHRRCLSLRNAFLTTVLRTLLLSPDRSCCGRSSGPSAWPLRAIAITALRRTSKSHGSSPARTCKAAVDTVLQAGSIALKAVRWALSKAF